MNDPGQDALIAEIERAIEDSRFADARRLLAEGSGRFGAQPAFAEIAARVSEVEKIAVAPEVERLLRQAQAEIGRASYQTALAALDGAVALRPDDPEVRQLREQTEAAARRHQEASERNRKVLVRAQQIDQQIEQGELAAARAGLQQATLEFGRHSVLQTLQERLEELELTARDQRVEELAVQGRALLEAGNWHGAAQEAERLLRLDPEHEEGRRLRDEARALLAEEETLRHRREAVTSARQDVERLLAARETKRATARLQEAIESLGQDEAFAELGQRIEKARTDLQFRQRVEWAERRSREAERLIREADALMLEGAYGEATARLESARDLDPSHPDVADKLAAAAAAHHRQLAEQRRLAELATLASEIRAHLDGVRLDEAEAALARAARLGGEERFAALRLRLTRLREVEQADQAFAAGASESDLLQRQRALAAAYSWKQTFLYPFRGAAVVLFCLGTALLVVLEVGTTLPEIGVAFVTLQLIAALVALALFLTLVRATIDGKNLFPEWSQLGDLGRWGRDLARVAALAAVAFLPLAAWLWTDRWHALLRLEAGPVGWLVAAGLGWGGVVLLVTWCGALGAFGRARPLHLARHARAVAALHPDAQLVAGALFALATARVVLGAAAPAAPWLAVPVASALEAYAFLAAPHLVGVLVRRHRLELARIYG